MLSQDLFKIINRLILSIHYFINHRLIELLIKKAPKRLLYIGFTSDHGAFASGLKLELNW